ncbi:MAG: hypothetical protein LBD11_07250 [Candidatus Peribacteria bacterium]|nr:hypothetical protein [Candidatus Peribacteria bacterium]
MQLFKRLLLSYFPESLTKNSLNPASMFVSFISAKDFFSIINRKIVENYKLNLFDISLDTFEFKIGLGQEGETTSAKVSDTYYGYLSASNFNGYKFYNVANTSNALVLVVAMYLQDAFGEGEDQLMVDCLYAFYLLSFLFVSRVKIFPGRSDQEDFNRFVELFFDFYGSVISQLKHKITKEKFKTLRKKLISKLEVFFLMFHFYRRINPFFAHQSRENEYFTWLFGERFTVGQKSFLANYEYSKSSPEISLEEEDMLFEVAPADIHLKYLFLDNDPHDIVDLLISEVYDKKVLDKKLASLMKNPSELDFILDYITDPAQFKQGYFEGMQKFMMATFRDDDDEEFDEFNEMLSVIGDDDEKLEHMKIPPRIKKESRLIEQFLNFYITYLGGLSIERADTFFIRTYKSQLLPSLMKLIDLQLASPASIHLYGLQQYFYSRNTYFYNYVQQNVRAGKEKFFMPLTAKIKPIKSNVFSLTMFDENMLLVLLQDVNPRISKLYIKNKSLLQRFQASYGSEISTLIKQEKSAFIFSFYAPMLAGCQQSEAMISILQNALSDQDVVRLKDALYCFDIQMFRSFLSKISIKKLKSHYSEQAILHLFANVRELLPGFLLYYHFMLRQASEQKSLAHSTTFFHTFLLEILGLESELVSHFREVIEQVLAEFSFAFTIFVEFDDNKDFFDLLRENWKRFIAKKDASQIVFAPEDVLWLRGTLKHITYYNKRYLIPG